MSSHTASIQKRKLPYTGLCVIAVVGGIRWNFIAMAVGLKMESLSGLVIRRDKRLP
jgi:hypothetical protein